jgi:citrate lyase beta subunit
VVTLPKVTAPEPVRDVVQILEAQERALGLPSGAIALEVMVESPEALIGDDGRLVLREIVAAGSGRCAAAHFGTYDYTAACGVAAPHQGMQHPACDLARSLMQACLARTGVWLSDGATTTLPVAIHRAEPGRTLSPAETEANATAIAFAWRLHYANVRDSLRRGFYQGWDLHPAQLPARYAATYAFFLEAQDASAERLRKFVAEATRATRVGTSFDDAATGQGLLTFFVRGLDCGAFKEEEVVPMTGLLPDELRSRSFPRILAARARA